MSPIGRRIRTLRTYISSFGKESLTTIATDNGYIDELAVSFTVSTFPTCWREKKKKANVSLSLHPLPIPTASQKGYYRQSINIAVAIINTTEERVYNLIQQPLYSQRCSARFAESAAAANATAEFFRGTLKMHAPAAYFG